ncbi:MAG: ParB N-terminal domain-containing protein [Thermodesulfobacteriota bacterium]
MARKAKKDNETPVGKIDHPHPETILIDVGMIDRAEWNPNVMKDRKFNKLVEQIREVGILENIVVRKTEKDRYEVVSGHWRYDAAKVAGYEKVPCVIREDWDDDKAKIQNMRFNVLKGDIDPLKFSKMWDDIAKSYDNEELKALMGFVEDREFERLYIDIKKSLPDEVAGKLDKAKNEIKTVDDLSNIVNELFTKHGDTLDRSYMIFSYGGKEHLYIVMGKELRKKMEFVKEKSSAEDRDINEVMLEMMRDGGTGQ